MISCPLPSLFLSAVDHVAVMASLIYVSALAAGTGVVRVFVADRGAKCVLVFRASGTFERYIGTGHLEAPYGVAVHQDNGTRAS